ncbi:hypothetical protein SDC9_166790 [bioreactor metagenome]|uniref:Uncharacterized protein n=1 Tax=bioreactor metagenome TaxID=1076179 RepID=A0A645FXY3_9ZZZZ
MHHGCEIGNGPFRLDINMSVRCTENKEPQDTSLRSASIPGVTRTIGLDGNGSVRL